MIAPAVNLGCHTKCYEHSKTKNRHQQQKNKVFLMHKNLISLIFTFSPKSMCTFEKKNYPFFTCGNLLIWKLKTTFEFQRADR